MPNGSAAGASGGASGGPVSTTDFRTLPHIAPADLRSNDVSGSDATFEPSTFLPYDKAVAVGQAVIEEEHRSVAEAAAENSRAHKSKAKAAIVENAAGDAVIAEP